MPLNTRLGFNPSDEAMQAFAACLKTFDDELLPLLIDLTADERRSLPKAAAKTGEFIIDAHELSVANPQFLPVFVIAEQFAQDMAASEKLRTLEVAFARITGALQDSLMKVRSQTYNASLAFYNGAQQGLKQKQPNAEEVVNRLSPRFPGRPKKGSVAARKRANAAPKDDTEA